MFPRSSIAVMAPVRVIFKFLVLAFGTDLDQRQNVEAVLHGLNGATLMRDTRKARVWR